MNPLPPDQGKNRFSCSRTAIEQLFDVLVTDHDFQEKGI